MKVEIAGDLIDMAYQTLEGCGEVEEYASRHGVVSMAILTQHIPEIAANSARLLAPEIEGKVVIEIGAGVGYLAMEIAKLAKFVWAIEVDPAWSWIFTRALYDQKPSNLTWIFGTAESVIPYIRGDIAIIFTRSAPRQLRKIAEQMAPKVIMPFQDMEYNLDNALHAPTPAL